MRSKVSEILCLLAVAVMMVCLCACAPERASHSDYRDLPDDGWLATSPVSLTPQFGDSTATYSVQLVVRNTTSYPYQDLNLAVDIIAGDGQVTRRDVRFAISDGYGNFLGSGFGALYQSSVTVAQHLTPAQLRRVVVWPAMSGTRRLTGVANVGIIVTPEI